MIPPNSSMLPSSMFRMSFMERFCQDATTQIEARPQAMPTNTAAVFLRIFNSEKIKT